MAIKIKQVDGLTAALSGKQDADATLTALAGVSSAADKVPYFTGADAASVASLSSFGRSLIDDADASASRTTLGLGSIATHNLTVSSNEPSGGTDGDIWFVI